MPQRSAKIISNANTYFVFCEHFLECQGARLSRGVSTNNAASRIGLTTVLVLLPEPREASVVVRRYLACPNAPRKGNGSRRQEPVAGKKARVSIGNGCT